MAAKNEVKFECPECNQSDLVEVVVDATYQATVDMVTPTGQVELMATDLVDGRTKHYKCRICGYIVRDKEGNAITDPKDLYSWLKDNDMIIVSDIIDFMTDTIDTSNIYLRKNYFDFLLDNISEQ